jgi:hypothetical protein
MSSSDPDFVEAAKDFQRGGWIVAIFGFAGRLARMLISDENSSVIKFIRHCIAGSIVGVLSYFCLHGQEMSGINKAIIMTTAGAFSPEIFERIRKKINGEEKPKKRRG